jgi:hypothetical protein
MHPTAFISYARDNEQDERVLEFAQWLRTNGIDCMIDRYVDPEDWAKWMEQQIRDSQWILVVASETYLQRARDDQRPDVGLGVSWEYADIRNILYGSRRSDPKVIPIIFRDEDKAHIPEALVGRTWYNVSNDALRNRLLRKLAGLRITIEPAPLGNVPQADVSSVAPPTETVAEKDGEHIPKLQTLVVMVRDENSDPISDAILTAVADNGTTSGGSTGVEGTGQLVLLANMQYTVLVAHESYGGTVLPLSQLLSDSTIVLKTHPHTGSVIGVGGTTHIPGLNGRLNPILDTSNRMYLYADNISINRSPVQPANFELNEPLELQDAVGSKFLVTVRYIYGRAFLLDYVRPTF